MLPVTSCEPELPSSQGKERKYGEFAVLTNVGKHSPGGWAFLGKSNLSDAGVSLGKRKSVGHAFEGLLSCGSTAEAEAFLRAVDVGDRWLDFLAMEAHVDSGPRVAPGDRTHARLGEGTLSLAATPFRCWANDGVGRDGVSLVPRREEGLRGSRQVCARLRGSRREDRVPVGL